MVRNVLKSTGVVCALFALTLGNGCTKKKMGEGKRCQKTSDCKDKLKCVNNRCTDFSGEHPACKWSLSCLKKLSEKHKKTNRGYEVTRWYKKLSKAPYKSDCMEIPKRIAYLFYDKPYEWKRMCGPPPVEGVKKITNKSNPFRINDKQIKAGNVPSDEKSEIHKKHLAYPDLCKVWVDFTLTRPFQGFVRARVFEQYDCDEEQYKKRLEDPSLKPKCKAKPYDKTDKRYIYYKEAGAKFALNFYISTPPPVCKKKFLSDKTYKSGCFCLGIDEDKLKLEWIDDPFLYLDKEGKRRKAKK